MEELPRRTREHIIADLSLNHLERFVLRCGHTLQRKTADYGYDAFMDTFDSAGVPEVGSVYYQFKATDSLPVLQDGVTIAFPLARRHITLWLREIMPVILVVYDAASNALRLSAKRTTTHNGTKNGTGTTPSVIPMPATTG